MQSSPTQATDPSIYARRTLATNHPPSSMHKASHTDSSELPSPAPYHYHTSRLHKNPSTPPAPADACPSPPPSVAAAAALLNGPYNRAQTDVFDPASRPHRSARHHMAVGLGRENLGVRAGSRIFLLGRAWNSQSIVIGFPDPRDPKAARLLAYTITTPPVDT